MKRKSLRDQFEENYMAIPVPAKNAQGFKMKYVYCAPWYYWNLEEKMLQREKIKILLSSVAGFLIFLLTATCASDLNRAPVVFLPSVVALCCHVLEFSGVIQLLMAKYRTTKLTFEEVDRILRFAPLFRAICCAVSAVACLFAFVMGDFSLMAAFMSCGFSFTAITAWFVENSYSRIPVCTEKNTDFEEYEMRSTEI